MTRLRRNRVIVGDARERLAQLPADSVDTVITSPPYFGMRNYLVEGQLGDEAHVEQWVSHLLDVADEVARVLKPSGSFWLNVGDSYSRHDRFGAPPKALLLGPERLLIGLSEQGWRVRNKVIWHKTNARPSSTRDRLSSTWEPLYLLTRAHSPYFDLDIIREPHTSAPRPSKEEIPTGRPDWQGALAGSNDGLARLHRDGRAGHPLGKNPRDVWRLPTSQLRSIHRATFPEALVERPLLATCPERVCIDCGLPWRRSTARRLGHLAVMGDLHPSCGCRADWQPGLVMDPFLGSGTVAVVAERLGRDWLGIELNEEFAHLAEERVQRARAGPDQRRAG